MACPDKTISELVKWVLRPVGRQLGYIAEVGERAAHLNEAMRRLDARSEDVEAEIRGARRNDPTQQPTSEVQVWLESVLELKNKVNVIKANYEQLRCRCLGGCSVNVYANWSIGRKATKGLLGVKELSDVGGAFRGVTVTRPGTPPPGQQMSGTSNLLGVDSNLQRILGFLADGAPTVGIYGMGGVGKTTLLKVLHKVLCSNGVGTDIGFERVIWVTVSRDAQLPKLQQDIAEALNLPPQNNFNSTKRAIFNFLDKKRFILLLDDVWEHCDLDEVGIPDDRVVVLAARSEEVCRQMGAHRTSVKVEGLKEEDAWSLFKRNAGDEFIGASSEIEEHAMAITKLCERLPLALILVGRAMSSKKTPEQWRRALTTLKRSQLRINTSLEEQLLERLKYSYDSLPDDTTREAFLLCALFPENEILDPYLLVVNHFWGHGLFDSEEECDDVGQVIDHGTDILQVLKSACLLEQQEDVSLGDGNTRPPGLRMHAVLREMAFWIVRDCGGNDTKWVVRAALKSHEPLEGVNDWEMAEKLSLAINNMTDLPIPKRRCEKLSTLMLHFNYPLRRIPEEFFQYFPVLSFLDLSTTSITRLPEEVSSLVQLQYLNLTQTKIVSLSVNLRRLKKLKHLRLTNCRNLRFIPHGLVSSLPLLQTLQLFGTPYVFRKECLINREEEEDRDEKKEGKEFMSDKKIPLQATTTELLEGRRLQGLGLNVEMESIIDLQNLVDAAALWRLNLIGLQDPNPNDFLAALLRAGDTLEKLKLTNFSKMEELLLTTERVGHGRRRFNRLNFFELCNFNGLNKIRWNGATLRDVFSNLHIVSIISCHGLRSLTWAGHLPRLGGLRVRDCDGLEQIISHDENDESTSHPASSIFPVLHFLVLKDLPKLHSISEDALDSPRMAVVCVFRCPELKRLPFSLVSRSANESLLHVYFADQGWWERLEWDDDHIQRYLRPFVMDSESEASLWVPDEADQEHLINAFMDSFQSPILY